MVAQVIVKNLASVTGKLGHREPHVRGDLHVALKALAGFVVHGVIISQISGQGQLLRNLFLRCLRNAKGEPQPPHLHEPDTANLLSVHGDIITFFSSPCQRAVQSNQPNGTRHRYRKHRHPCEG